MTFLSQKDFAVQLAVDEILREHGDRVSVVQKAKGLTKFGQNNDIGTTEETVWGTGGTEVHVAANDIDTIVSTDVGDTQEVIVEGHTVSGSDLTFVSQSVTLNGLTNVALTTSLFRASRMWNNNSTDFAGTVTVFQDGVNTHLTATTTDDQSQKCATSLSSEDYWIMTGISVGVNRTQTRSVDFKLQIREFSKVYRTRFPVPCTSSSGMIYIPFRPCIIARPNSDIRVTASSSGASTGVFAILHGYLALIT